MQANKNLGKESQQLNNYMIVRIGACYAPPAISGETAIYTVICNHLIKLNSWV